MRVVAWNIRSGGGRRAPGIAEQLLRWRPDLVLLSEFRHTEPSRALAGALEDAGLDHQRSTARADRPAQNALLLASRWPLRLLSRTTGPNDAARWLPARVAAPIPFSVGGMHVPNAATGRKYTFHDEVLRVASRWHRGPSLLVGDTNSGVPGLDEEAPAFTPREEAWIRSLCADGWRDAYRHLHGNRRAYSWYSPNGGNGFRLDQAFLNCDALEWLRRIRYVWGRHLRQSARRDELSDHAALVLDLLPRRGAAR